MTKTKLNGFALGHIGASKTRSYEDRSFFGDIKTKQGLVLTLAIVSDGVGGGNLGQRAAELTIETIKKEISNSDKQDNEIPQILGAAIGAANKAVYYEARNNQDKSGMSATVAVAAISNGKLYVANVGDSRIYLINRKESKQITTDHTFIEERLKQGIPLEKLENHPSSGAITRSVGFEQSILVDLGLYFNGSKEDGQKAYANQGLTLDKDDVILVCSDGLIKERHRDKNRNYVETKEILDVIKQYHAEQAAKVLVDLAVGRDVDDNVTAVVVEHYGRKIATSTRSKILYVVLTAFVLSVLIFVSQLAGLTGQLNQITEANANATNTAAIQTSIAAAYTKTPTATPRPTLIPGEVGALVMDGIRIPFLINTPVSSSNYATVYVNHTGEYEDGKIYMLGESRVLFETEPSSVMNFVVFPGSLIFVDPGRYSSGAGIRMAGAKGIIDFEVAGSCMGINYKNDNIVASCYEGTCSYQINFVEKINIPTGKQVIFDSISLLLINVLDINVKDANLWRSNLPINSYAWNCLTSYIPDNPEQNDNKEEQENHNSDTPLPPTDPAPTDPAPTDPAPTDPAPTDPAPTDPAPTDPPSYP